MATSTLHSSEWFKLAKLNSKQAESLLYCKSLKFRKKPDGSLQLLFVATSKQHGCFVSAKVNYMGSALKIQSKSLFVKENVAIFGFSEASVIVYRFH